MKRISYLAFINKYAPFTCFFRSLGLVDYHNREWIKLKFYSSQHDTWCTQPLSFITIQPYPPLSFLKQKSPLLLFETTILPKKTSVIETAVSCGQDDWFGRHSTAEEIRLGHEKKKIVPFEKYLGHLFGNRTREFCQGSFWGKLFFFTLLQKKRFPWRFFFFFSFFQNGCAYIFNTMSYSSHSI